MSTNRGKAVESKDLAGAPSANIQRAPASEPPQSITPSTEAIDDEWGDVPDTLTGPVEGPAPQPAASPDARLPGEQVVEPDRVVTGAPVATDADAVTTPRPPAAARWGVWAGAASALLLLGAVLWFAIAGTARDERAPTSPEEANEQSATRSEVAPSKPTGAERAATSEIASASSAIAPPVETAPAVARSAEAPSNAVVQPPGAGATRSVAVQTVPPGAELYERGQRIGRTPLALEVAAGERRRFEVGMPGYQVRKLVIDGSRAEVVVGLRETKKGKK